MFNHDPQTGRPVRKGRRDRRRALAALLSALLLFAMIPGGFAEASESGQSAGTGLGAVLDAWGRILGQPRAAQTDPEDSEQVAGTALDFILDTWQRFYRENAPENADWYAGIRNTRVFWIAEDPSIPSQQNFSDKAAEYFGDMLCIVEFMALGDPMGTSPYYMWLNMWAVHDHVIVYRDGRMESARNPFTMFASRTYIYDFSGIIEEVVDLGDGFNGDYDLSRTPPVKRGE